MSRSLRLGVAGVCLFAGFLAAQDSGVTPKEELDRMQGKWLLAGGETDGTKLNDLVIRALGRSLTIKGDRFVATIFEGRSRAAGDYVDETQNGGILKIDPARDPREIDLAYDSGPLKGQARKGIYRWEGDRLVICLRVKGTDRPREFKTQKGDDLSLDVFKKP
jgi:uncharacterized protein (TIGR03067 family)